jgi:tetratricopeptide (TPR) repeat protein
MNSFIKQTFITTCALLLAVAGAVHAQVQLGADLQPRSTPLGDPVRFAVKVVGQASNKEPIVKVDPSISVRSDGVRSNTEIFNGQISRSTTYSYALYPSKIGEFKVEAEVPTNGDALLTDTFILSVREKTAQEKRQEPFLKLSTDARSIYVGQDIPIEVTLFIAEGSQLRNSRNAPELETNDFIPSTFNGPYNGNARVPGYSPIDYRTNVTAFKAGKHTLGPATLSPIVDVRSGPRYVQKQFTLQSDPIQIEVKPLPEEGKPASFNGAVGTFQMTLDAEPLKLTQGDPISVTIKIAGDGSYASVEMPELSESSGWKLYPSRKFENNDRRTNKDFLTFTQVLVPEASKAEIPPFEFSYFDPDEEKYKILRTDAIPIEVTPDNTPNPVASASDAGTPATTLQPVTPDASTPIADMTDILSIRPMATYSPVAPPLPIYKSKAFWAAQSIPAAAFTFMFLLFVKEKRSRRQAPKVKSHVPELSELTDQIRNSPPTNTAAFYELASSALNSWEYHSGKTIASLNDSDLEQKARQIREHHATLRYSGAEATNVPIDNAEREEVINTLTSLSRIGDIPVAASVTSKTLLIAFFLTLALAPQLQATPEETFTTAESQFQKGEYAEAAKSYQSIIDAGKGSPDIYYNLGTAQFRAESRGQAALAWHRALHIDPQHSESRQNLGFLKRKAGFLDYQSDHPQFGSFLSHNNWIATVTISAWLLILSIASLIFLKLRAAWIALPVTAATIAVTMLGVSIFAIKAAAERTPSPDRAIVITEETKAYNEPATTSSTVISLPPGSEVNILLTRESWTYVDIPGKLRGWVQTNAIAPLAI